MNSRLEVRREDEAWSLLSDCSFLHDWETLHRHCPWATPFQTPGFVRTWFSTYKTIYSPIIAFHRSDNKALNGLLILALSADDNRLYFAGTHHAEYQVWLESDLKLCDFIIEAIGTIMATLSDSRLVLRYLPSKSPIKRLQDSPALNGRIEINTHTRPLWKITASDTTDSLRKKSNKSRLNRLKRLGTFEFKRLQDLDSFSDALDQGIPYYDFQQGATHNSYPFLQDELKKEFHIKLLRNYPELLHITVMTIDGIAISMHLGVSDDTKVHLGIIAHSPMFAKFSPGKLHLLLLGKLLVDEGKNLFDLTPGGDQWKERFANAHDRVYELIFYESRFAKHRAHYLRATIHSLKNILKVFGIQPRVLRDLASKLARLRLRNVSQRLRRELWWSGEYHVYRYSISDYQQTSIECDAEIKKDFLPHLLLFKPSESSQSKQEFLQQAKDRLENGNHVYTCANQDKLLHYGWLIKEHGKTHFKEVDQQYVYSTKGIVFCDFYTRPEVRGQRLCQKTLIEMLKDVNNITGVDYVYTSCFVDNKPYLHAIEKTGFVYYCSLYSRRVLGRSIRSDSGSYKRKMA